MMRLVMVAAVLAVVAAFAMAPETEARRWQRPECPEHEIVQVKDVWRTCGITMVGRVPKDTNIIIHNNHGGIVFSARVSYFYALTNLPDTFQMWICFQNERLEPDRVYVIDGVRQPRDRNECVSAGSTWYAGAKVLSVYP